LYRGVERVAVDVRDAERLELLMAEGARRAARATARLHGRGIGETVAAETSAHGGPLRQIALPYFAERLAASCHFGRIEAGAVGKCDQQILVSQNMLQDADKKVGIAGGVADRLRCDAGRRDETVQPAIVLDDEGKRLNRQHFGRFTRVWRALLHRLYLRFRKNRRCRDESSTCGGKPNS